MHRNKFFWILLFLLILVQIFSGSLVILGVVSLGFWLLFLRSTEPSSETRPLIEENAEEESNAFSLQDDEQINPSIKVPGIKEKIDEDSICAGSSPDDDSDNDSETENSRRFTEDGLICPRKIINPNLKDPVRRKLNKEILKVTRPIRQELDTNPVLVMDEGLLVSHPDNNTLLKHIKLNLRWRRRRYFTIVFDQIKAKK